MKPKHNYAKLDKLYLNANWKEERLALAKELGFNHISESTIKLYRKHKSLRVVGKILGVSDICIRQQLEKFGEPRMPPGGPWRRKKMG
jgi:hypothetical protein